MFFYLSYELAGQPHDIWHDPNAIALMSLGVAIAAIVIGSAVAIVVGIYQVRQGRTRRKLVCETLFNAPLISVNSAIADQVEIDVRVKGTLIKDAYLLVVNIKNAGKVSIHASDYFEPLVFEFDTKVLQASVLETTPPSLINPSTLPAFLTLTQQSVQFPTFPLNPGDTIQISILLEGKGTLEARGRLDQGTVVELEPESLGFFDDVIRATATIMVFVVGILVLSIVAASVNSSVIAGMIAGLTAIGAFAVVVLIVSYIRRRTKQ